MRDRVVGGLIVTSRAVFCTVVHVGQRDFVARGAFKGAVFHFLVVRLVLSVGAVLTAVVDVGEGDEGAVVALEVGQFLKVVGGLVASVLAVLIAVVDPFEINAFAIFANVVCIGGIEWLILSSSTVFGAIVEKRKADHRAVVIAGVGHGTGSIVFIGCSVAILHAVVDEDPRPGRIFPINLTFASIGELLFIFAKFQPKPVVGAVRDLIVME